MEKTEDNCRQFLVRAKKQVSAPRARFEADKAQPDRLVKRFIEAGQVGDLDGLLAILADDITLWADGGGKVKGAALEPVTGATQVARRALGFARRMAPEGIAVRAAEINGQPGVIAYVSGKAVSVLIFDIQGGRIRTMYALGNPDKLASVPPLPAA